MRLPAVLLLLLLAASLVACSSGEPDTVRIGLVGELSGPNAPLGVDVERGARMAVEDLNDDGGLLGRPVELVIRDSAGGDPVSALRDLQRRGVVAVIGPSDPGAVLGRRSPLAPDHIPAVLPTAFTGDLEEAPSPVVRVAPSARDQAATIGGWLVDQRGIDEVAVLVADPLEADGAERALRDGLTSAGARVTALVNADPGPDLTPAVSRLRREAGQARAVFLWGPSAVAARATAAVRSTGWDVQIIVPSSAFVGEYRSLAQEDSEGVVLAFPYEQRWFGEQMEDLLVRWHQRHRIEALAELDTLILDLPVAGVAAYDAVGVVASAVTHAGSSEPSSVASSLRRTTHEGLLRTYHFDDPEAWEQEDLYVARIHNLAVIYDVDPRMDPAAQRRFHDQQVRLEFLPEDVLQGRAGELIADLLEERRRDAPPYRPPAEGPQPVSRPQDTRP